ncbi:MAG: LytTR family transcriptional regulator DNA-binding domain-containing protein [Alistipes sp.]|nr:LytTR family transcriptional regulator DNA-binding domain-containing protein [Alistipes sp.]
MLDLPNVFRKPTTQVIHIVAVPLAFFAFVLIYRPFNLTEELRLGSLSFGVNLTLIACVLFGSMLFIRALFYGLRNRINRPVYYFWVLLEATVAALFVALYAWLMARCVDPYFVVVARVYGWLIPILLFPYVIISMALYLTERSDKSAQEPEEEFKMRFYDERKNLKLVVTAASVLYIAARENYVQVVYEEGERVRDYLVRASMRSIESLCEQAGLKRCHRSYYLNPHRVKTLRREKEGVIVAELDVTGQEVPVTKRYYDMLVEVL